MKVKHILFDLDGTLTDPKTGITRCIQYALEQLGVPVPPVDELVWCIGPPLLGSLEKLLKGDTRRAEIALSLYRERFQQVGKFENIVYPEIPNLLAQLNRREYQLFVATSKPRVYARDIIAHFNLSKFFQKIYGSELDGTLSQKADLIGHILEKENLPAQNTLMVGDREHDIIGAKACGVQGLGVTYGYGSREELEEAGANHIIDAPTQLLDVIS